MHEKQERRRKEGKAPRPLRATEKVRLCVLLYDSRIHNHCGAQVLGAALIPDSKTNWIALESALRADLACWRGQRSLTDRDEYDTLTRELISCSDKAERTRERVLTRISRKQQLLTAVQTVARNADGALMDRLPGRYSNHFLQISRDALVVDSALDDLILRFRDSVEELNDAHSRGTLYWQTL